MTNHTEIEKADKTLPAEVPMLIEPFFRKRSEAFRIQRLQTQVERLKFADAFAMVGCLRCHSKERQHAGSGMCTVCRRWYSNVLQKAMRARKRGELPEAR